MDMKMRKSYLDVEKRILRNREDTLRKHVFILHILSHSDCSIKSKTEESLLRIDLVIYSPCETHIIQQLHIFL